ncbi:MAG: sodium-dependent transporter [Eubacterium sp.]|nr:sodium-dependent transporter [Eubacterium sp.]
MEHEGHKKEQWGSRFGFLMATIGSAVGLGNLWGFPYKMGNNGGFAFLLIYLILFVSVGVAMTLTELSLGRKTGKGVVGAYKEVSSKYTFIGWLGWLSPLLILAFYNVLGGYCVKYMIANLGDIFHASWGIGDADSGEFFAAFYTNQFQSTIFTLIFLGACLFVVGKGVSEGIEKFSAIAIPALFVMLVIVIIRACTMPGASEGLAFVFKPNFEVFKGTGWISVLASAGGQLFFSLSLAMGIMITYGSYVPKDDDLQQSSIVVPFADTLVAVMAAMATMPAVFSAGLDPGQGPGMIFVTLQTVFQAMGAAGPFFGFLFYVLVFIAAFTSCISVFEAVVSTVMDWHISRGDHPNRLRSVIIIGVISIIEATLVSLDGLGANGFPQFLGQGCWLDSFDLLAEGLMMPFGALCTAILFGWIKSGWLDDEIQGGGYRFWMKGFYRFSIKFVAPIMMFLVLIGQINNFFGLGWF